MQAECRGDDELILAHAAHLGLVRVELILDVADEFLDHVVERDDAGGAAELIHDEREVRVTREEKAEQLFQRHHLGDIVQLALDARDVGLRLAHGAQEILDVDEADRLVEVLAAEGKTSVPRVHRAL